MALKFTIKLLLFLILLYGGSWLVNNYLDQRVLNDRGNKVFWMMEQEGQTYDVAVVGPSSVYNGVNPVVMEEKCGSVINLSFHGLSALEQLIVTKHFLAKNQVDKVALYMHPPVLHSADIFNKPSNIYVFLPYLDEEPLVEDLIAREHASLKYLVWKYYPISKYLEFNSRYFFPEVPTTSRFDTSLGFSAYDLAYDSTMMLKYFEYLHDQEMLIPENGMYRFDVDSVMVAYYDRFYQLTREAGVELVLFEQPINPHYYSYTDLTDNRAFIKEWASSRNIQYLDMSNLPAINDTSNFYDDIHLKTKGADIFSATLADSLCSM